MRARRRTKATASHGATASTEFEVAVRLVLVDPPAGVDFGIQKGRGSGYETIAVQQRTRGDITFDFSLTVRNDRKDGRPNFTGPFAQGPADGRFVYVDVGTYAGQKDTPWSRRMKIPLAPITCAMIEQARREPGHALLVRIPGKGRDGTPSCATAKPIGGWEITPIRM